MGAHGNALKVSICAGANGFSQQYDAGTGGVNDAAGYAVTNSQITVDNGAKFNVGDIITFDGTDGISGHSTKYEITGIATHVLTIRQSDQVNGGGLTAAVVDNEKITRRWKFHDLFDSAPGTSTWAADKGYINDEMHIVVYDNTGAITGFDADAPGQRTAAVLETFGFLSQKFINVHSQLDLYVGVFVPAYFSGLVRVNFPLANFPPRIMPIYSLLLCD